MTVRAVATFPLLVLACDLPRVLAMRVLHVLPQGRRVRVALAAFIHGALERLLRQVRENCGKLCGSAYVVRVDPLRMLCAVRGVGKLLRTARKVAVIRLLARVRSLVRLEILKPTVLLLALLKGHRVQQQNVR